ncbi:MAG: SUMF1/EgtB/PvdO family nonheme iron enzyme [Treponema sp.]|nr:SUMF1/EgtB/PvdO family nonheme iron enzyme [Treponema sp.]
MKRFLLVFLSFLLLTSLVTCVTQGSSVNLASMVSIREYSGFTNARGALLDRELYNSFELAEFGGTRGTRGGSLPESVSLKEYAPVPGNQLNTPSCAAWSTAYAARTIIESIVLNRTNKSLTTKMSFAPLYFFNAVKYLYRIPQDHGLFSYQVLDIMKKFSLPRKYSFEDSVISEYFNTFINTAEYVYESERFFDPITGYSILFHESGSENYRIERVKTSLANDSPVIIGFYPPISFYFAEDYWEPGKHEINSYDNGGHAICVVGYDDKKYGGAFEVMNSWGEEWGNGGFTWISYETFGKWIEEAWVIDIDPYLYNGAFEYNGKVNVELSGKNESPALRLLNDGIYRLSTTVVPGTNIRLNIESIDLPRQNTVNTYIFYTDAEHSKLVRAINGEWINTNDTVKAENIIILFSRTQLDIASLINNFEKESGSISNRLEKIFGNDFIRFINSDYLYDSMRITSNFIRDKAVTGMVLNVRYDTTEKPVSDMIKINGGSFRMGSPSNEIGRFSHEPYKNVVVKDFYIEATEVTVGEFREFINSTGYITTAEKTGMSIYFDAGQFAERSGLNWKNPGFTQDSTHPVVHISYFDAVEYCNWLSSRERLTPVYTISGNNVRINENANGYRLPYEAEWEYACRAGTTTPYNTGESIISIQANIKSSLLYKTTPVRKYAPNQWGLYNMHGNVVEWCSDQTSIRLNVVRGSSWMSEDRFVRSAFTRDRDKRFTGIDQGFRLARNAN